MSRRTRLARLATGAGLLALVGAGATTAARYLPSPPGVAGDTWAMLTSFTDFGVLGYAVALPGLLTATLLRPARTRVAAVVLTAALATLHLSWIVPRYLPDGAAAGTPAVRVLSQNLMLGEADPTGVVANAGDADVLVLVELTEPARTALVAAGIEERFGYQSGGPLPSGGSNGTRVYSRYPVLGARPLDPALGDHNWLVELDVPDLGVLTVVAVHPTRPVRGGTRWAAEQEQIRRLVPRERTVVAGDFNAVDSHPGMRRFRADGFRDSDEVVGAGWAPTYPALGPVPALIGIDHVLLSPDLTATAFRTVRAPGSDHRGVLATVATRVG